MNKHRKPPKGITVSALEITLMLLLGTVGVLMVLASQAIGRKS